MNSEEVKAKLGLGQLNLVKGEDGWYNHFDNDNRRSIGIHQETVDKLQADSNTNLGITNSGTRQTKEGKHKGENYELIHIVAYTPADLVL